MSGGYFDYAQFHISEIASQIEELIKNNNNSSKDEWGDTKGRFYNQETISKFKEALHLLRKSEIYVHRIDWLLSGDDDEANFHERIKDDIRTIFI